MEIRFIEEKSEIPEEILAKVPSLIPDEKPTITPENIRALFVGINKFQDRKISSLKGARPDAERLHALIQDNFPGIPEDQIVLLTDENATRENILEARQRIIDQADENDIIIAALATHGTASHRLVCFDTDTQQTEATTIPLTDFSQAIMQTREGISILLIDTCFAGGANPRAMRKARFFDSGEGIPRGGNDEPIDPIEAFEGHGKVIIAASEADRPSFEHPNEHYGLLMHAFQHIFTTEEGPFDLMEAITRVKNLVPDLAAEIRQEQTPRVLGELGGTLFPSLQPGNNFRRVQREIEKEKKWQKIIRSMELTGSSVILALVILIIVEINNILNPPDPEVIVQTQPADLEAELNKRIWNTIKEWNNDRGQEFPDTSQMTQITPEIASILATHDGGIDLSQIEKLDQKSAEELAKHSGGILVLNGIRELSQKVASALAKHKGTGLWLEGIKTDAHDTIKYLGDYQGTDIISIGITHLSESAAEGLARYKGRFLYLNSITQFTDEDIKAIEKLSGRSGGIWFTELKEITDGVAQALAAHPGIYTVHVQEAIDQYIPLANDRILEEILKGNFIHSHRVTKLSQEAASVLSKADIDRLNLDNLTTFKDAHDLRLYHGIIYAPKVASTFGMMGYTLALEEDGANPGPGHFLGSYQAKELILPGIEAIPIRDNTLQSYPGKLTLGINSAYFENPNGWRSDTGNIVCEELILPNISTLNRNITSKIANINGVISFPGITEAQNISTIGNTKISGIRLNNVTKWTKESLVKLQPHKGFLSLSITQQDIEEGGIDTGDITDLNCFFLILPSMTEISEELLEALQQCNFPIYLPNIHEPGENILTLVEHIDNIHLSEPSLRQVRTARNRRIFQQIEAGNLTGIRRLTYMDPDLARLIVSWSQQGPKEQAYALNEILLLRKLETLPPRLAQALSGFRGMGQRFDSLEYISPSAAAHIIQMDIVSLQITGALKSIEQETLENLARFQGPQLAIGAMNDEFQASFTAETARGLKQYQGYLQLQIKELNPGVATEIAEYDAWLLDLSIQSLSIEDARILAENSVGRGIKFTNLSSISDEALAELIKFDGVIEMPLIQDRINAVRTYSQSDRDAIASELFAKGVVDYGILFNLEILTANIAKNIAEAANQDRPLRLERLVEATPEAIEELAAFPGDIELERLQLTPEMARAFQSHQGTLKVNINQLNEEVARELAKHQGPLHIIEERHRGSQEMTPSIAQALAQHQSRLILQLEKQVPEGVFDALSQHGGEVRFIRLPYNSRGRVIGPAYNFQELLNFVQNARGDIRFEYSRFPELNTESALLLQYCDTEVGFDSITPSLEVEEALRNYHDTFIYITPNVTEQVAQAISICPGELHISLNYNRQVQYGLLPGSGERLAQHNGTLRCIGQFSALAEEELRGLSTHTGTLIFNGGRSFGHNATSELHQITPHTFANHHGELVIENIEEVTQEEMYALLQNQGPLHLLRLRNIILTNEDTKEQLLQACRDFPHGIYLDNNASEDTFLRTFHMQQMDPDIAEALMNTQGPLTFAIESIQLLSERLKQALAGRTAATTIWGANYTAQDIQLLSQIRGNLILPGCSQISPEMARVLQEHQVGDIMTKQVIYLSAQIAEKLAQHPGDIIIEKILFIDPEVIDIFRQREHQRGNTRQTSSLHLPEEIMEQIFPE